MNTRDKKFRKPELPKPPEGISREELILWYENVGQLFLAKAMELKGVLNGGDPTLMTFSTRCAPIVRMVLEGELYVDDVDWDETKRRAEQVMMNEVDT